MAIVLGEMYNVYRYINEEWSDIRTKDLLLMKSPIPVAIIIGSYVYFSKVLGPRLMEHRKPFELNRIIMVYNIIQVIWNTSMFVAVIQLCWTVYDLRCEPMDYTYSDRSKKIAYLAYIYLWNKIADLLDTIFFVLRKKNKQVTFLHVYHHGGMILGSWFAIKLLPGGHGLFVGTINTLVHSIMYSYYFLTSWKPEYKKSIWWKKHITQMQMVQFLIIFLHQTQPLYMPNCDYPKWASALVVPQNFFMFALFADFYVKTYIKTKPVNKE